MILITTTLFAFMLGAVVGSFLNVVIHRVPLGESVVHPPSRCPTCGHQIKWYDNIPIFSWAILLRAKCRGCKSPISARYALVEALTGGLAAAIWLRYAHSLYGNPTAWLTVDYKLLVVPFFLYFVFICLCVVICFIDFEHTIIPHGLSLPGIILGLASPFVLAWVYTIPQLEQHWPPLTPSTSFVGALAGAFVVVSIFVIYFVLRGIPGMGGGDVTLMALVGAWLGWPALFFIFLAASLQGIIAAGIAMALGNDFIRDANEIFEEDAKELAEKNAAKHIKLKPKNEASSEASPDDSDEAPSESSTTPSETPDTEKDENTSNEEEADEGPGPAAVPFGPFIVLAALEYYFLGPWLPDSLNMASFYFY